MDLNLQYFFFIFFYLREVLDTAQQSYDPEERQELWDQNATNMEVNVLALLCNLNWRLA